MWIVWNIIVVLIGITTAHEYLGCYVDTPDNRLTRNTTEDGTNSGIHEQTVQERCHLLCHGVNGAVYGVRKNSDNSDYASCFCAKEVPSIGAQFCSYVCPSDTHDPCGSAEGGISVFTVCDSHEEYGSNCNSSCHCRNNLPCRSLDGSCPNGCATGYYGPACDMSDIDECETVAKCGVGGSCVNTEGYYTCDCENGYNMHDHDGPTCEDADECSETNPCGSGGRCVNTQGSYTCSCYVGFTLLDIGQPSCTDMNECLGTNPCNDKEKCTNIAGSFSCTACPAGYTVHVQDNSQCIDSSKSVVLTIVAPVVVVCVVVVILAITGGVCFARQQRRKERQNGVDQTPQNESVHTPHTDSSSTGSGLVYGNDVFPQDGSTRPKWSSPNVTQDGSTRPTWSSHNVQSTSGSTGTGRPAVLSQNVTAIRPDAASFNPHAAPVQYDVITGAGVPTQYQHRLDRGARSPLSVMA